jgi:beta-glucanase (GH16 family)
MSCGTATRRGGPRSTLGAGLILSCVVTAMPACSSGPQNTVGQEVAGGMTTTSAAPTTSSGGMAEAGGAPAAGGMNSASSNGGVVSQSGAAAGGPAAGRAATGGNPAGGVAAGGMPTTVATTGLGGNATGGKPTGGAAGANRGGSGGTNPVAGAANGGKATGGKANGGAAAGESPSGGRSMGGASTGGNPSGGKATGGTSTAGGSISAAGSAGCLDGPAVVVPSGYKLVWADEFDIDGTPDSSNWGYETGFVRNEEAQWYQSDNAWVEKGCLVIEGRRERKTNPNYTAGSSDWKTSRQYAEYTSSSLRTMSKRTWQYGRFELRGRIKTQAGLWPAWWTLGVAKEWPSCGEIDIMEFYGGKIHANVACGTSTQWQAKWDSVTWDVATFEDKNWQNEFHTWRMDWDDTKIDLLLDDKLVNTTILSDMLNADGSSPFKQAHYMLINLAIGGQSGGDPSGTAFPTRYEVDYVRVFQKQ